MTSPATSDQHLSKFKTRPKICRLRRLWVDFLWRGVLPVPPVGGARITKFHTVVRDNWPHKLRRHIQQICVVTCPGQPCEIWYSTRHQLEGQVKRRATKSGPKAVGSFIFGRFQNFYKCRSEVAGDVVSGVALDQVFTDGPCNIS